MRLNTEQVRQKKEEMKRRYEEARINGGRNGYALEVYLQTNNLFETIEAQQQEIEQLQAQNMIMRDALKIIDECGGEWESGTACEALSTDATTYHNPADVAEELRCCSCGIRKATVSNDDGQYCEVCAEDLEQEEAIDLLKYHNPADVEKIEQLEYTLLGIMHSVDKWVDEVDESVDEVNRAAQAREIALQAIEKRDEVLKHARALLIRSYDEIEHYKCLYKGSKAGGCDCPQPTILQGDIEQALAAIDKVVGK